MHVHLQTLVVPELRVKLGLTTKSGCHHGLQKKAWTEQICACQLPCKTCNTMHLTCPAVFQIISWTAAFCCMDPAPQRMRQVAVAMFEHGRGLHWIRSRGGLVASRNCAAAQLQMLVSEDLWVPGAGFRQGPEGMWWIHHLASAQRISTGATLGAMTDAPPWFP